MTTDAPSDSTAASAPAADVPAVPVDQVAPATPAPAPAQAGAVPEVAADNDRIEQEWVIKTKQVLLATHNDPFEQAQQLAVLKADYMRKRYNKEIKLGE